MRYLLEPQKGGNCPNCSASARTLQQIAEASYDRENGA